MAKTVKIRTLVAMAGADFSLAAGDEYEVDPEVAKARVEAGIAEYVDEPAAKRATTKRAGAAESETTAAKASEARGPQTRGSDG
jgi:hypothetical protein